MKERVSGTYIHDLTNRGHRIPDVYEVNDLALVLGQMACFCCIRGMMSRGLCNG